MVYLVQRSDHVHEYWVRWFRVEDRKFGWPLDVLSGFVMCCALLSFAGFRACSNRGAVGSLLSILESKPAGQLGAYSYSLYLINGPLLGVLGGIVVGLHMRPSFAYGLWWAISVPAGLLGGYLFYLAVERRCVSARVPSTIVGKRFVENGQISAKPLADAAATVVG